MHPDQVVVDAGTARRLVRDQFPPWTDLPVRPLTSAATVNTIFRLGDELTARFPLRLAPVDDARCWLGAEAAASDEFAHVSPVAAPRPVALGEPGHGYPMPWSVQTWVPGRDATSEDTAGSLQLADDLGALLRSLRSADTRGRTFQGRGRGGHLPDHEDWMDVCFRSSEHLLDVPTLRVLWAELRDLPEVDSDMMGHGDLTPPNVLVHAGRLTGVLDTGGFAAADPALDLVACWHLLDDRPRQAVRDALSCGDVQWRRGMAWAFQQAMGLVWYYERSNPVMSSWGRRTLDRIFTA
jgi:aminoglycoside phosphotransferase (APT) family kinase protein